MINHGSMISSFLLFRIFPVFAPQASGLTVKEKWTTKNVVTTEVSADNKLVKGLSTTLAANFSPSGGG